MKTKDYGKIQVTYLDTPYICTLDTTFKSKKFCLVDTNLDKIISRSDNPMDFDNIIYKQK